MRCRLWRGSKHFWYGTWLEMMLACMSASAVGTALPTSCRSKVCVCLFVSMFSWPLPQPWLGFLFPALGRLQGIWAMGADVFPGGMGLRAGSFDPPLGLGEVWLSGPHGDWGQEAQFNTWGG